MKYCIFSDVHGNYVNLVDMYNSTIQLKIDKYICLGDLCNYFSDNKSVIDFIIDKEIKCIIGNHDQMYINDHNLSKEKIKAYNYDFDLLKSNYHIEFLKSLQDSIIINEHSKALLCHGSPNDFINQYIYPDTNLASFKNCEFDIIFCGHTHRQFLRHYDSKIFCNVGSVGLPRDNGSLMGFVTYDSEEGTITLYRKLIDKHRLLQMYQKSVPREVLLMLSRKESINFQYTTIE
jgi:putative phosphoesterase